MALPNPPFDGACLCGAVRVRVTAPPLLTLACHCRDCQKLTASAYSLTTMFPSEAVTVTGDLVTGGLGTEGRTHSFCASCLSFVLSRIGVAPHRVNLRTTMLDGAGAFVPFAETMARDKLPLVEVPVAQSYETYPQSLEELDALMDAYAQL